MVMQKQNREDVKEKEFRECSMTTSKRQLDCRRTCRDQTKSRKMKSRSLWQREGFVNNKGFVFCFL